MTHTEYTKNILNIKDKNVFFNENCLETKTIIDLRCPRILSYMWQY